MHFCFADIDGVSAGDNGNHSVDFIGCPTNWRIFIIYDDLRYIIRNDIRFCTKHSLPKSGDPSVRK